MSPREAIDAILSAALRAADPRAATAAAVGRAPPRATRPAVLAIGKATKAMVAGFRDSWGGPCELLAVVPDGAPAPDGAIVADHPIPSARSVAAAAKVRAFVTAAARDALGTDGFVVLLSGGASALVCDPLHGISIADYGAATVEMIGLEIRRLNTIRKHCEGLKGGQLALLMGGQPCETYVLSDVIGDDLSTIGSGPTVGDPTTFEQACEPFGWELENTSAARVLLPHLQRGAQGKLTETPKPGDPRLSAVRSHIVGSNTLAIEAAARAAASLGFKVQAQTGIEQEASEVGRLIARRVAAASPGTAIVLGGETTVRLGKHPGRGGRNQELALAAAIEVDGREGLTIVAFGTDGVDGNTDAAGAVITGRTCQLARAAGLDPQESLSGHDSFTFFEALDRLGDAHLIRTGPTGTNVNDVVVALRV